QLENAPTVWIGFMIFLAIYVAGFDVAFDEFQIAAGWNARLLLAFATLATLTYIAVLFEPKDVVLYRWLSEAFAKRHYALAYSRLQAWMLSFAATMGVALFLLLSAATGANADLGIKILTLTGFLTRDVLIFLAFSLLPGARRGDLPGV